MEKFIVVTNDAKSAKEQILNIYEKENIDFDMLLDMLEVHGLSVRDTYNVFTELKSELDCDSFLRIEQGDTDEFVGCLVDVVEDWLDQKEIAIPNPERDKAALNDESCEGVNIWGEDYDILSSGFEKVLGL